MKAGINSTCGSASMASPPMRSMSEPSRRNANQLPMPLHSQPTRRAAVPAAMRADWAYAAVGSATIDRAASDEAMPCNVTARTPSTKPPTTEKGRQPTGATIRQPMPGTNIVTTCRAQNRTKPAAPTARMALQIGPKPHPPMSRAPKIRPAAAATIERFSNLFDLKTAEVRMSRCLGRLCLPSAPLATGMRRMLGLNHHRLQTGESE